MAKFLTTKGMSAAIENIVKCAKAHLVLVTPYVQLSEDFRDRINEANNKGIQITLIYGKEELRDQVRKSLDSFEHLELIYHPHLHAKCYHNGNEMIIGSMNLYEYSEKNNREMGILLNKEDDPIAFSDALNEIRSIRSSKSAEIKKEKMMNTEIRNSHNGQFSFYLPALNEMLLHQYPGTIFNLDDTAITFRTPGKAIVTITFSITIEFLTDTAMVNFKRKLPDDLFSSFAIQYKWNSDFKKLRLDIDQEIKGMKMTEANVQIVALAFMNILKSIWHYL